MSCLSRFSLSKIESSKLYPCQGMNATSTFCPSASSPVSVAAPSMVLASGAVLTVVAVQASATGAVWVLERASDGARATLHFSGHVAGSALLSTGAAVAVTALASGHLLSAAGQAIAFIPNELGRALLHNERITR